MGRFLLYLTILFLSSLLLLVPGREVEESKSDWCYFKTVTDDYTELPFRVLLVPIKDGYEVYIPC